MSTDRETTTILHQARKLIQRGANCGFTIRDSGSVEQPIPVLSTNHSLHSWFVPVTVGSVLAGFFEFQPDLTFMRYSSFQRHEDSLEGCPAATLWIDSRAIRDRVSQQLGEGEKIKELFLTYDRVPSRLVWAAVLEPIDEMTRIFYIAGNQVWETEPPGNSEKKLNGK